jgi:subtilisin family serine protease
MLIVPRAVGQQSVETAVMKVKNNGNPVDIAGRYGVIIVASIPELNKYLVQGSATNLGLLRKDSGVASVDYDTAAEITESGILAESTVALLDPDNVALLFEQGMVWDGQHWVKSSLINQPALKKIGLEPSTVPFDPVIVAVIDTGIDPSHETLLGSTLPGWNFIDPKQSTDELNDLDPATAALLLQKKGPGGSKQLSILNPSTVALLDPSVASLMFKAPTPYFGHGTMVSGLIHAIAPRSVIMPLKVFDASGRGTAFRIAQAIIYAANHGASVINMSFSLEEYSAMVDDAIDYASRKDVALVASVGNKNSKVDKSYPARDNNVVGVAATDMLDQKTIFSNYGPASDVAAPGEALLSPYPAGLYAVWSGTSASAALVSGEAALLLSQPDLKNEMKAKEVSKRIIDRSDHIHVKFDLGKGRINVKTALGK